MRLLVSVFLFPLLVGNQCLGQSLERLVLSAGAWSANGVTAITGLPYSQFMSGNSGSLTVSAFYGQETLLSDVSSIGNTLSEIKAFPSPTTGFLTIQSDKHGSVEYQITVVNTDGKNVLTKQLSEENTTIDMTALSSGIYLVQVSTSNQEIYATCKVIKH